MAEYRLNWFNNAVIINPNATAQRASYRPKTAGGPWITTGFDPSNNLPPYASTVKSPNLTDNIIYEFRVEAICTEGGPTPNNNGDIEGFKFSCIVPTLSQTDVTAQAVLSVTGTDITKARFTLRKDSDNSIVYGPTIVNRVGNFITASTSGLDELTDYYWQVELYATVSGSEIISSSANQLNALCGPYDFTTDETVDPPLLEWRAFETTCETEGLFGEVSEIDTLSSPWNVWYDDTTNRVWVADFDSQDGNVYWFNPDTATTAGDMNYSTTINDQLLYNNAIDTQYRRIYFVGRDSGGLMVYDIDTDSISIVAFGTDGSNFSRTALYVLGDRIYCNYSTTHLYVIDRATLTILNTVLVSGVANPTHFNNGPFVMVRAGSRIYVCSSNSSIGTVGVYSLDFSTSYGEITLPSAATWTGGTYWQYQYYDSVSDRIFIHDSGSNRSHVINPNTNTVVDTYHHQNRGGKSNSVMIWQTNPITGEFLASYAGMNSPTDGSAIYRTYVQDRTTFAYTQMFEGARYNNPTWITGTDRIVATEYGLPSWAGTPGWDTDGIIRILSISAGVSNTGRKITTMLQEVDANDGDAPTGNYKPNTPGDPDYIDPVIDLTACAAETSLDCPISMISTFSGGTLNYEFTLPSSVVNNPAVDNIQVYAYDTDATATEGSPVLIDPVDSNYYAGSITGLTETNYVIRVVYRNSSDVTQATCTETP